MDTRAGAPEPVTVDNRGMLCAQGIVRLMRMLVSMPPGQLVRVLSDDPAAEHDYPAWCANTGHQFLRTEHDGNVIVSYLKKRAT